MTTIKKKLALALSLVMLFAAAVPASLAQEISTPSEASDVKDASGGEDEKTVAAPGATWEIGEDGSVDVTIIGEEGLRMYVDVSLAWDDEVYAGEIVTFTGFEAGKSYDIEVDYYDVQEGVYAFRDTIDIPAAPADTQTTPPAETQTTPPASTETTPPADTQTTPPVSEITPPPAQEPAGPKQFDIALSQQDGVITAEVIGASDWEVTLTLLLGGAVVDAQAVIGDGSVTFAKQGDGVYTVRAAYVTPADGVSPVDKTIEIKNTGASGSTPETEKTPTVWQLGAQVTSGDNWIEVKVTDADNWPLYVAVGYDAKTVSAGESVRFENLAAGSYDIEVDYVDPVDGVSPFRSSVDIVNAQAKAIALTAAGGENRIEVIVTDASTLPIAVTVQKDGAQVAQGTIPGGVGKLVFEGLIAGEYSVIADYAPAQSGVSAATVSGIAVVDPAPAPAVKEIVFSATGGVQTIEVSITDASPLPVSISVMQGATKIASKTIAGGVGKETFDGLSAGVYSVVVNYDPAQTGVSAKTQENVVVTGRVAGITITDVRPGDHVITVSGTAQPGADIALTTTPAAQSATIVRANAQGGFKAEIVCQAGTYTQVKAVYVADNTVFAVKDGTFIVTAPNAAPTLTVDPVSITALGVVARTTPGVTVKMSVGAYNYTQTLVADSRGMLQYSLPQTLLIGTKIVFTVYYGANNALSFESTVTVVGAQAYNLLKYGDTGADVKALTARLTALGYLTGATNRYSSAVREAVRLFQEINGLDVDGIAGTQTQSRLYSVSAIALSDGTVYPTLVRGDKGLALIRKLQQRLKDLGYYTIAVDGIYGSGTQRGVRDFQRVNGLPQTGKADNATQQLLYSSAAKPADSSVQGQYTTLKRSSRYQSAVVTMQRRLKTLGYAVGSVDGYFGSRTQRAVRDFQRRNGLSVTGIADAAMQQLLYSSAAKPASGSSSSSDSTGYRLLYWGCTGDAVRRLQSALLAAGYTQVRVVDGIYGNWTYDAVRAYQRDHGLAVDGVAGKNTQNSLYGTKY